MSTENWLLVEGRVYRLVEVLPTKEAAMCLLQALSENCVVVISQKKDGKWGVYWRPKVGSLCPYGVV